MQSSVKLVCVDPDRAHEMWPYVSDMLRKAALKTDLNHFADIEYDVKSGEGLLWIVWNGSAIEAAATTVLVDTNNGKACVLTACGGVGMSRWVSLIAGIEDYARKEGCDRFRIYGRKGWSRVLNGYGFKNVILEKAL